MVTDTLELADETTDSRHIERWLLALSGVFVAVNFIALGMVRPASIPTNVVAFIVWTAGAIITHIVLNRLAPRRDVLLLPCVMLLSGWGLVIIDRLAPNFADRQTLWLAVSLCALLVVVALPDALRWLRMYRYLWLAFGMSLFFATVLFGSNPSGFPGTPQLWLKFGAVYFQPSEALKIILVAFLASYLAEQYPALRRLHEDGHGRLWALSPRVVGPILLMWGISVMVLIWQRDLGTAVLFFAVFIILIYTASGHPLIPIGGAVLIALAAVAAYQLFDVVQLRFDIWINPWPESDGRAYQIVQSLQAIAAGGIFGQGVALGYPNYIPVVHSDFAFAALAEEWGLVGVVGVLAVLAVLIWRGLRIALLRQSKPFYVFLAVGLCALLLVQSVLIMGGVTRLLPLTGVTLPFVSYGGSSMLVSFIMVGLLLRLSDTEPDVMF